MEIKIPSLGESVTEALIAEWLVKEGQVVKKDENLVSIDSEKATVEIPAPSAGKLVKILKPAGETASTGDVIAEFEAEGAVASESEPAKPQAAAKKETPDKPKAEETPKTEAPAESKAVAAKASPAPAKTQEAKPEEQPSEPAEAETAKEATPAEEAPKKEDKKSEAKPAPRASKPVIINSGAAAQGPASREDEIKPLSQLRRTVAKRLVEAQHTMAILTTFNEIDMTHVMALRKQYQESFLARHGVKIGFMSFFVKAVVEALKEVPQLNGEIRGNDIVLHKYIDIGVAIGAGKGLVVPPLRNAERLSFAEIEKNIADLATRAQANKLKPEELEGGTFTISNGGVYGSLLSTPIINPPQSGILGLHSIQERPVVRDGQIVIRSMMYAALSYDHRLVDGREAVTFLRRVKDIVEDPMRLLLEA